MSDFRMIEGVTVDTAFIDLVVLGRPSGPCTKSGLLLARYLLTRYLLTCYLLTQMLSVRVQVCMLWVFGFGAFGVSCSLQIAVLHDAPVLGSPLYTETGPSKRRRSCGALDPANSNYISL